MAPVSDNSVSVFRSIDWWTIAIYLLLLAAGWVSVVGASYSYDQPDILDFAARSGKQLTWIGCSFVLALVLLLTDERIFDSLTPLLYVAFMLLLLATPFVATNIKGSYSWISLGPVSLQPAEFAKCATALMLARYMGSYSFNLQNRRDFLTAVGIVALPVLLIFMQHETGSALVYLALALVFYREGMSGTILFVVLAAIVYFVVGLKFSVTNMPGTATPVGTFFVLVLIWAFTLLLLRLYDKSLRRSSLKFQILNFRFHISSLNGLLIIGLAVIIIGYITQTMVNAERSMVNGQWSIFNFQFLTFLLIALCVGTAVYLFVRSMRQRSTKLLLIGIFAVGSLAVFFTADYTLNHVLAPHQQQRVKVLLGLEEDLTGAGYNVHQSEIAIGSGGFAGKGFLNGTQTKLKYVPEQDTDFIFCTVGEEHGFVGSTVVLLLFLALILRLIHVAERQTIRMARIYGYCVISIFLFHVLINIGMVMGIMPVIGIPLPFFSYGGSSLWGFTLLLFIFLRFDAGRNRHRQ